MWCFESNHATCCSPSADQCLKSQTHWHKPCQQQEPGLSKRFDTDTAQSPETWDFDQNQLNRPQFIPGDQWLTGWAGPEEMKTLHLKRGISVLLWISEPDDAREHPGWNAGMGTFSKFLQRTASRLVQLQSAKGLLSGVPKREACRAVTQLPCNLKVKLQKRDQNCHPRQNSERAVFKI